MTITIAIPWVVFILATLVFTWHAWSFIGVGDPGDRFGLGAVFWVASSLIFILFGIAIIYAGAYHEWWKL